MVHAVMLPTEYITRLNNTLHNGSDMQGLLYIEYGFHLTLMVAGLLLAYSLLTLLRPGDAGVQAGGAATARVRKVLGSPCAQGGTTAEGRQRT